MLPHRIGRYDVSAELGRGATGIVYKGVDPATGRLVALKTLQRNGSEDAEDAEVILQRFRNEARIIGRLHHPGVVAVKEFGEDGLHSWIAMEYVEGANLDELLLRTPVPGQERATQIMDELLDALGSVHRQGVCHRDLKPANIMVTSAGRVKLTDFGVARLRDLGLTQVSSIIGTPAFMAPEQFKGGAIDPRADLFACGVLLFLLLSGRRPFTGAPAAVMHQILHEEPPLLSAAGGGVAGRAYDELIARALAKRPQDRFASAEEMRDALRAATWRAAEATTATVVKTMVQDTTFAQAGLPVAASARPGPADEGSLAQQAWPMGRGGLGERPGLAARVDAFALYAPDADGPTPSFDSLPHADADGPRGTSAAASDQGLSDEAFATAQQLLARRLGPVATVIARRAADAAGRSRPVFMMNLLAETPADHRAALRAELQALLYPPQRTETGR